MFRPPPQPMWDITYCPLWAFPFRLPLKVCKTCLLGRGFHTFINGVSFSSPTEVGYHILFSLGFFSRFLKCVYLGEVSTPLLRVFRSPPQPRWDITYCPLWAFPFGLPLKVFKTCLLGRGFYTVIKGVSFSSATD